MNQGGDKKPRVVDWTGGKSYLPLLEGPPATCGMRSGRVRGQGPVHRSKLGPLGCSLPLPAGGFEAA